MQITNEYLMSDGGLELLNKIFLGAGEGIIIVNKAGLIKLVNRRAEEIFEYPENELIDKKIEDLIPKKYHEAHVGHREGYIKDPVARPMGIGRHLTGLRKSGNEFPVEVSLSFLHHENERLVVAFVSDITKRKEQEDALKASQAKLKKYNQELETKVSQRTQELEYLNLGLKSQIRERKLAESALKESLDELKKAKQEILIALEKEKELNEMKSKFVSMASHEFRTPLTTIQSSANLVARYTESDQQANREKHVNRINSSVENLTNILNDFLSLEKLETGSISVKAESFSLDLVLEEIQDTFEMTLKKGQRLLIDDSQESRLNTDPHILKNILINLISNAIKYSPEDSEVKVEITKEENRISFAVKDQGIGIPSKDQKQLFSRFFRAENATNIQGTGLGLDIVKRYLQLIGGDIIFESTEGKGSEFTVTIPQKLDA